MNPASARAHFWRAYVLQRMEEGFVEAQRSVELDPISARYRHFFAQYWLAVGQAEQALEQARHAIEIAPAYYLGQLALGEAHSLLGRHEEGIAWLEKAHPFVIGAFMPMGFLAWAYVRGGRRSDAERFREGLEERRRRAYLPAGTLALVAAALDDRESAYRWVDESIRERDPNISLVIRSSYFQLLQSDPRYPVLLRRMNLQP